MFKVENMLSRNSSFYGIRLEYLIAFLLLFNAFSWYFFCNLIIDNAKKIYFEGSFESLSIELAYPSSVIISAILASLLFIYVSKKHFFVSWILLGIVSSLSSAFISEPTLVTKVAITVFMGSSLGIGMPMCLDYFTKLVPIEKRGKIGGITFLVIVISAVLFILIAPELDSTINAIVLTAWRGWGLVLLPFVFKHEETFKGVVEKKKFYQGFPWNRTFFLYFVTWFMFALVSGFGANIVSASGSMYLKNYLEYLKLIEPPISGFSAVITGAFSDWIGRKRVITFGFASLGFAYAVLGLAPSAPVSWFLYYIIDGIATGILWVTFIVVLWGEISHNGTEKSYAIGEVPYFLTAIVSSVLAPFTIPIVSAFSVAALFLFVAVILLMYAPETLPEKKIRDRELKVYIEQATKIKEKYA